MTERERLIELLNNKIDYGVKVIESQMDDRNNFHDIKTNDLVADYLLANGVIVPPCNIDDTVYWIDGECISEGFITTILMASDEVSYKALAYYGKEIEFEDFEIGETVFLTKEEAEKALKRSDIQ